MVKNKVSCGFFGLLDADGADGSPFLAGNGRSVLNRRFINLIIVVDDLPFGIADFLTANVAVFFQFRTAVRTLSRPSFATNGQPFQAVIPIVRQGEHIGQQSLGFQGQSLILQVVVAHNGVVDIFIDAGMLTWRLPFQPNAGRENAAFPAFGERCVQTKEACCELAQQRQHCIFLTDI